MICFVICAKEFLQGNCLLSSQTLCYLTRSGTKLCLHSSSQSCFNLQSSPHILCVFSSPWKAPPSHPVNNHINPGADFPSLCFARPAALPFPLAPGLASSDCCVWSLCAQPKAASLLSGEHSMSVGTVLFQSSSYGKEGSLLCCLGEGTSEPGVRFTGRMLSGVLSCPVPSLCFSKCFKEDEVLSSLSLSCSMRSATGRCKIASFYWGFGLVKCFFSMSSYMVFQK